MKLLRDLPRAELERAANDALARYPNSEVHFKFTCEKCGRRCMLSQPNMLFEEGECDGCGHVTKINQGGFMLHLRLPS